MKKMILLTLTMLFSVALLAKEINPENLENPDFNHYICLSPRDNNKLGSLLGLKTQALVALYEIHNAGVGSPATFPARFARLHPAAQIYYKKLSSSLSSNGQEHYSSKLDEQLNLAGSCESTEALLLNIVRDLYAN